MIPTSKLITPPPFSKATEKLDITDTSILTAKAGNIVVDKDGQLLREFLEYRGMTKTLIDVYNNWIAKVLPEQIMSRTVEYGDYVVRFVEPITLLPPYTDKITMAPESAKLQKQILTPKMARDSDLNYVGNLQVSIEVENIRDKTKEKMENVPIGSIPVMLGSAVCHTHNKSEQELVEMGECACDPQGYFIVKGSEKNILLQENLRYNRIFVFMGDGGNPEVNLTSAILTGTSVVSIHLDEYEIMYLQLTMFEKDEDQKNKAVPVFLLFRLYTDKMDHDLVDYLLQFTRPEWKNKVRRVLEYNMLVVSNITDPEGYLHEIRYKKTEAQRRKEEERKSQRKSKIRDEDEDDDEKREEEETATSIFDTKERLLDLLFPHMNSDGPDRKMDLLATMIVRLAENASGVRPIDERDDWGNKKLESAGRLMEQLFNGIWKKVTDELGSSIRDALKNSSKPIVKVSLVENKINKSAISDDMRESFTPNQWGVRAKDSHSKGYYKANITDYLKRDSLIMTYSHLMRINTPVSRKAKITHIRVVQGSQTGYVCPVETPEGEGCGIVKAMTITCQLTTENSAKTKMVENLLKEHVTPTKSASNICKMLFNGRFLGWVDGASAYPEILNLRRRGVIERDVSIVIDSKDYTFYVYTDSSRVSRPLLIVDGDDILIDGEDEDDQPYRGQNFDKLLAEGIVEYLDAFEQNTAFLAKSTSDVEARTNKIKDANLRLREAQMMGDESNEGMARRVLEKMSRSYTHCELDPNAIFGVSSSLIPFPDRNQAPRNVYQAQMGKQAVGMYSGNYLNRMDTSVKVLAFPSRPLFETQMNQVIGLTDMPNGQMVTVAFMTYTGYNQEDAIIFNQASIDRGLFWYEKLFRFAAVQKSTNDYTEHFMIHPDKAKDKEFSKIDPKTGLPFIGTYIERGDVVIPMCRIHMSGTQKIYTDISIRADQGENGYVRRVFKGYNFAKNIVVKVRVSQVRKPIIGDKFASRYAQKGTIGMILPEQDMPFVMGTEGAKFKTVVREINGKKVTTQIPIPGGSRGGMRPDLIINPHSIPSRMTMGKLIEVLSSKLSALKGERVNATAFKGFNVDDIRDQLRNYGYNHQGYELMASGFTGQLFGHGSYEEDGEEYELTGQLSNARQQAEIYIGPCFYQMLPHHVIDKITTRGGTGGIDPLTHQPGGGYPTGGQRSGEMERDAMISHGATSLIMERFCSSSDQFTAIMCLNCGTPAVNENHTDNYTCKKCKEKGKFARLKYPYSTMYLQHMLSALGLDTRFRLRLGGTYIPEAEVKEEVVFKDEEEEEGDGEDEEYEEPMYMGGDDLFEGGYEL